MKRKDFPKFGKEVTGSNLFNMQDEIISKAIEFQHDQVKNALIKSLNWLYSGMYKIDENNLLDEMRTHVVLVQQNLIDSYYWRNEIEDDKHDIFLFSTQWVHKMDFSDDGHANVTASLEFVTSKEIEL